MTKLKDLEWFCPQPFMNTLINNNKVAKPCCVIHQWPEHDFIKSSKTSVMDVHNSDLMKSFRKEILTDGGPLTDRFCLVCKEQEKYSKTESHRIVYNNKFDEKRDKYRGTCLTDIFPEWKPYYEKL